MRKHLAAVALGVLVALGARSARADETSPPPHHTAGPWIVVGVGAASVAVGVLSFVGAVKAHDDVESESAAKGCTTSPTVVCPAGVDASNIQTNLDGEHAMNVIGVVLTAAGGSAVVAGLVWHFLEPRAAPKTGWRLQPAFGPGAAGLSITGRF
jgi:hypothetical protein